MTQAKAKGKAPNKAQAAKEPKRARTPAKSRFHPDGDLTALGKILKRHADKPGALIPVLQEAQGAYGYLPVTVIEEISRARGVPLAAVYGVATFYAQFRLHPHGETVIRVCHGTACHVSGAETVTAALEDELGIESGGTTGDRRFTLEKVACLGCCSLAPVMMVGEKAHGRLSQDAAREVIRKYE